MSDQAQSPLVNIDLSIDSDVLSINEIPFLGNVNLRGATENPQFLSSAEKVLGGALPTDANTFVEVGGNTILWYGPNEWMIITPSGEQSKLISELRAALGDVFSAVTDVSGGNTVIEISGSAAADLIAKGTPFDIHPSVFSVGQCAQTVFAHAGATIYQVGSAPTYRLLIRRSFSDYLGTWVLDAVQEYA